MRPRVIASTMALLAGALLTVAVAWACQSRTQWGGGPRASRRYNASPPPEFTAKVPAAWVAMSKATPPWACMYDRWSRFGVDVDSYSVVDHTTPPWVSHRREDYVVGWPFRALSGTAWRPAVGPVSYDSMYVPPGEVRRELSVGVLVPGFAANTAFYAALVATGWTGLRSAVRRTIESRRRRRNLCPGCEYPVTGAGSRCPECGRPQ